MQKTTPEPAHPGHVYAGIYVETVNLGDGVFYYAPCFKLGRTKHPLVRIGNRHPECFTATFASQTVLGGLVHGGGGIRALTVGAANAQFEVCIKAFGAHSGVAADVPCSGDKCSSNDAGFIAHSESFLFGLEGYGKISAVVAARAVAHFEEEVSQRLGEQAGADHLDLRSQYEA